MPQTPHLERHFTAGAVVRDVVIGMSDGLTVPFALAAGLTGAVASAGIVVTAGLAEIAAGSIAMGLGGYLAAKSDAEHYAAEQKREQQEVIDKPREEMQEVADILRKRIEGASGSVKFQTVSRTGNLTAFWPCAVTVTVPEYVPGTASFGTNTSTHTG